MKRYLFALLFVAATCSQADEGKLDYRFDAWQGPPLQIYLTQPPGLSPGRPVVVVMHGMQRNAGDYRDQWHELAIEHDFLLVVPEFSSKDFPGSRGYNLGNVLDEDDKPVDPSLWSFSAIEQIFDDVRQRFSMQAEQYAIYGHSAGSQFVHRFLMHVPDARVSRAVAANAGWYTAPDFHVEYPYGLKGSMITGPGLEASLTTRLTILLGKRDTDMEDNSLRQSEQAVVQGPHRLARGYYFLDAGKRAAADMGLPLNWRLAEVEGADHDNAKMAPAAVNYLLSD